MNSFILLAIFSLTVAVPLRPLNKPISEFLTKPSSVPNVSTPSFLPHQSFNSTTVIPVTFPTTENSIVLNHNETSTISTIIFLNTTTEELLVNQTSTIHIEEITTAMKENQIIEETEGSSDESSSTTTSPTTTTMTVTSTESSTTVSNISHIDETGEDTTEFIETSTTVRETTFSEPLSSTIIEATRAVNSSYFADTEDETTESIETTTFVLEEVVKHEVEQVFSVFGPYVLALTVFSSIFLIVSVVFRLKRSRKLRGGYSPAMEERYSTATYSLPREFIFKDERLI